MTVDQRLTKLENTNRRWRFCVMGLGVVLIAVVTIGADKSEDEIAEVIRARRFEVVNDSGKTVVEIWGRAHGYVILRDEEGQTGVEINGGFPHPSVNIYGLEARVPVLSLHNYKGNEVVKIWTDGLGGGKSETMKPNGNPLVSIHRTIGSGGEILTFDTNGKTLVVIGATRDGEGAIGTYNRAGGLKAQWP